MKLESGGGLVLHAPSDRPWSIGWGSDDWFGPIDLLVGGKEFTPLAGSQSEGEDDLGAFRVLELRLDGSPLPLRASARAYPGRALLVFRLEAAAPLHDFASGQFERPSVAWPRFHPARRCDGGLPGARQRRHIYR